MNDCAGSTFSELWVCFEPPPDDPPPQVLLLSFLPPAAEAALQAACGTQVVSGRILVQDARGEARAEYVRLVARIGTTECEDGRTLRQCLQGPGEYSRWWFLDLTEKDCLFDEDTVYITVLQLTAMQMLTRRQGIERVTLVGAPAGMAAAVENRQEYGHALRRLIGCVVAGIASRAALAVDYIGLWWMLRGMPARPRQTRDVLLQGYWDWTVGPDRAGKLVDRYFTSLPSQLAVQGLTVGWLASCEPHAQPWQRGRARRDVIAASCEHADVWLLERELTPIDIVRVASNLRYPFRLTRFVFGRQFRLACQVGMFDLSALVRDQLLRSVWGGTFCRLQLSVIAIARACRTRQAGLVLTCFEFLLRSRAYYAGVRASASGVRLWAAQHAGYSTDKTLGILEPDAELRGAPDGCAIPAPDGIFAMGELSRRIWEGNGLAPDRVVTTGGLRYEGVRIQSRPVRARASTVSVLLLGGMCEAAHLDLCNAVVAATSNLPQVRISWRDHPLYLFSRRAAFRRFQERIATTSGSIDEDLEGADLVLFTQTGLAEEALLRGIPTWQWLWPGFNTSPFLDVPVIPAFTSAPALRRELEAFIDDPAPYSPSADIQRRVLHECFGTEPAAASGRIAEAIRRMLAPEVAHT